MSAGPQPATTPAEWDLLPLTPLLWGGLFVFVGVAATEPPPLAIAAARAPLAAAWGVSRHDG